MQLRTVVHGNASPPNSECSKQQQHCYKVQDMDKSYQKGVLFDIPQEKVAKECSCGRGFAYVH